MPTVNTVLAEFQNYMRAERGFSPKTIRGYNEAIRFFVKVMGDLALEDIKLQHFITLKTRMAERGAGQSRVASMIHGVKCLLLYAHDVLEIRVMDLNAIKAPKAPRRAVIFLSPEEFGTFVAAIPIKTAYGLPRVSGYCFRALVETLFATGMRISEALRLNRSDVDFTKHEAVVVGKRGKPRSVYFTDQAIQWLSAYLALRSDSDAALFVSLRGSRLAPDSVGAMFRRTRAWAGLKTPITPHILRHTAATTLLRNGCPIGFIREILGHEDLQTTCRYYLGKFDKEDVRHAHARYMSGETPLPSV